MNITPQSIYIIVPAIKERTNEFTLEDQKGNVLSYLERKENMIVMTVEQFEKAIVDAKTEEWQRMQEFIAKVQQLNGEIKWG